MVDNVTETARETGRSQWTDVPLVSRTKTEEADKLVRDEAALDSDNTLTGAVRRDRIKGGGRKNKEGSIAQWALVGGTNASLRSLSNVALDDQTSSQLQDLSSAVKMVGGALGAGLAVFGIQAAFVGGGTALDTRRALKDRAARTAAEETTDKVAKTATETVAKGAAEESAEIAIKGTAKTAFSTVAEAGTKLGTKRIPFAGAFVTAAFAASEVSGFWSNGERGKAVAAGFVGAAETVGNFFTFGLFGDAFREVARQGAILVGGDEYADVAVSDVRALYQAGVEVKEQFTQAAAVPQVNNFVPKPTGLALAHG